MLFKASAPGSTFLMGEYAVLYGKKAIVCALDKRIDVSLFPRSDPIIRIVSEGHGAFETTVQELSVASPFLFVTALLFHFKSELPSGFDLMIASEFSDQIGLGSSAAVVAATLAVVLRWLNHTMSLEEQVALGQKIIASVQGKGSGADMAASVYGGVLAYQANPLHIQKIANDLPIVLIYSGFKTKTSEAILRVEARYQALPEVFEALLEKMGKLSTSAIQCVLKNNLKKLGALMDEYQIYMEQLGVNNAALSEILRHLRLENKCWGAKISGAGFGDCVIGLGEINAPLKNQITCAVSAEGVLYE